MTDQQQIEKAAQIMHDMNGCADPYGTCISTSEYYREMAQALADAGLLARADRRTYRNPPPGMVPADYYTPAEALELLAERDAKIERAEAERANLEADYDRRGERLWRLAVKAGHTPSESDNDASAEHSIASALAERDAARKASKLNAIAAASATRKLDAVEAERDKAREECGHQRALKEHIRGELTQFITLKRQAEAERDALAATVQRVRDLHKLDRDDDGRFCAQCCESWPCGTLEILDDPQEQP